jgi:hypothetical protein
MTAMKALLSKRCQPKPGVGDAVGGGGGCTTTGGGAGGGGGKVGIMMIGGGRVGITGGVTTTVCGTTTVSTIDVHVGEGGVSVAVVARVAVSEGAWVAKSATGGVALGDAVAIGVTVAVLVTVGEGVIVAVAVGVSVDVAVRVLVRVAVGCGVTSWAGAAPGPMLTMSTIPMSTGRSICWGKRTIGKRKGHTTCKPASKTDFTVASGELEALSSL